MRRRWKRVVAWCIAIVMGLVLALGVYGVAIEPRFILDERHYEVELPDLGEQWAGTELAVFSDPQLGMSWANTSMVERVVDRVVAEKPAAALIAGDFLYSTSPSAGEQVETTLALLEPITQAGIPMFVVLGNHDHKVGAAEELTRALQDAGITVLANDAALVPAPTAGADPLYAVGLAADWNGLSDAEEALSGVPDTAARVVLMHNPTSFPHLPAGTAPLAVAGHTHCGQVAIPGLERWSYLALTDEERGVAEGFAAPGYGAEGNALFVTCGIGFSIAPVRIGAAPQLVFFELLPTG